jgi:cytochrome b
MTLRLPRHIGHNPLGGWMILTLLTGLTLLVTT